MSLKINVLPALHGDAIVVEAGVEGDVFRILIDGGPGESFERVQGAKRTPGALKLLLDEMAEQKICFDLTILTHVDDDHIGGLLKACAYERYRPILLKNVWFNSGKLIAMANGEGEAPPESKINIDNLDGRKTGIAQGVSFDEILDRYSSIPRGLMVAGDVHSFKHCTITVLSPTPAQLQLLLKKWEKEAPSSLTSASKTDYHLSLDDLCENDDFEQDSSVHNGSSIAILIETPQTKVALLADAYASTVCQTLRNVRNVSEQNPLIVDVCKISHHGSKGNTSEELLSLLQSKKFIVSTNGLRHGLPNKQTLARIRKKLPNSEVLFNYANIKSLVFPNKEERERTVNMKYFKGDMTL